MSPSQVAGDDPEEALHQMAARCLGMARVATSGRILWANRALATMAGYDEPAELVAARGESSPLSDASAWSQVLALLEEGRAVSSFEAAIATRPGHPDVLAMVHAELQVSAEGAPTHVDLVARDVTALARRRQRARDAATKLIYHLKNTSLGVIEWDVDFNVVEWNAAAERIFGFSRAEMVGRHASLLVPPEAREHVAAIWRSLLDRTGGTRSTNQNLTKSGQRITCDWYNTTLVDGDEVAIGVFSLVVDVTTTAAIEAELASKSAALTRAEKMATLGLLVAGIAHEIKNPLNFIAGFAELSRSLVAEIEAEIPTARGTSIGDVLADVVPDVGGNLERIRDHALRVTAIVQSMLMHARDTPVPPATGNLNALVRDYVNLAHHSLRAGDTELRVDVIEDYDPALCRVHFRQQELARVVLNLVANALYALRERQRLAIAGYAALLRVTTRRVDGNVEVSISDNAGGIPEALQRRIFDPFFTTKPAGEGTGLGLSMCRDIVTRDLGGRIELNSTPNEGSEFRVIFPAEGYIA